MRLYEATNGYTGFTYVRCLVWANDETEALWMAKEAFKKEGEDRHGSSYYENVELQLIVDSDEDKEPFCTEVTDG
ncbi:hypothetical protein BCV50_00305 [Bacillus subtilis]|nr:hypothetical protein BCV50_00305 [Bacillus subtilis]